MGNPSSAADAAALFHLRLRWALWALISLAAVGLGFWLVLSGWAAAGVEGALRVNHATRWVLAAAAGTVFMLRTFWLVLGENRRQGELQLLPGLGPGSWLTSLRGLLIALVGGFLFMARPAGWLLWVPAVFFTLAMLTDYLDGYAARVTNHQTRLGERLDMSFDSWAVLVGSALIVQSGQVPLWYMIVALARPLFILGISIRHRLGLTVYDLPYRFERRALAGVQMGFITVMVWPVFAPPGTHIAAAVFALPFLLGFGRDWLVVSGVLAGKTLSSAPTRPWLPLVLRVGVVGLGAAALWSRFEPLSFRLGELPAPGPLLWIPLGEVIVLILVALGVSGRTAAIAGLLLLGAQQALGGLSSLQILLIIGYTGVLFAGTGPFSLWAPEEWLIRHRAGERRSQLDPKGST